MQKILSIVLGIFLSINAYSQCNSFSISSSKNAVCAPEIVTFQVNNAISSCSYSWNLGDGWVNGSQTAMKLYSHADSVDISVRITLPDGSTCTLTEQDMIIVHAKPTARIHAASYRLCNGPETLVFTDTTFNSISRNWIIDGTNYNNSTKTIQHKFTSTGAKSISLIAVDSFGCQGVAQLIDSIKIYDKPAIDFTADQTTGCAPQDVTIEVDANDQWSGADFKWSLNGSTASNATGSSITTSYTLPGRYEVSLHSRLKNGCDYTTSKVNYLKFGQEVQMDLDFNTTEVCVNEAITLSLQKADSAAKISWNFDGIAHRSEKIDNMNFKLFPLETGTLSIEISHLDKGCRSTEAFSRQLNTKAVSAAFSSADNFHCQVPHTVHLTNTSDKKDADTLVFKWRIFNDDSTIHTSNSKDDSMQFFELPASYHVELIAIGDNGCSDTARKKDFIIQDSMKVDFSAEPEIGCIGQVITFKNNSRASTHFEEDSYKWTFFDRSGNILDSSELENPSRVYQDTGIYAVRLIGYNSFNCTDTLEKESIEIIDPIIGFELSDSVLCFGQSFSATSTTLPAPDAMDHQWRLTHSSGQFRTYKGLSVNIKPFTMGEFTLTYTFEIAGGCQNELSKTVHVNGIEGEIIVDAMQACAPFEFSPTFSATSNHHFGNAQNSLQYEWTATPSAAATVADAQQAEPTITLQKDGFYTLGLKVTNSASCTSNFSLEDLQAGVIADFRIKDKKICMGDTVLMKNRSKNSNTTYRYELLSSNDYRIFPLNKWHGLHTADTGIHRVQLIASLNGECSDTAEQTFEIVQVIADFSSNDTFLKCAPVYVQFNNHSINADSLYWDFGDGTTYATTEQSAGTIYTSNTDNIDGFDVQLIASNKQGCQDTLTKEDFVFVSGPLPHFIIEDNIACDSANVQFTNQSINATSTIIDYMDGSPLDSAFGMHRYHKTNTQEVEYFYPTLYAEDDNGCVAEYVSEQAVTLFKSPDAQFTLNDMSTACAPFDLLADNQTQQAKVMKWYLDDVLISNNKDLEHYLSERGHYKLALQATDKDGCTDSDSTLITLYGAPELNIEVEDSICLFNQIEFSVLTISDELSDTTNMHVDWTLGEPNNPDNIGSGLQTVIAYQEAGQKSISAVLTLQNGCSDTAQIALELRGSQDLDKPKVSAISFMDGYNLEVAHQTTTDLHFSAYRYQRSDGSTFYSHNKAKAVWTDAFISKPDSSLCYDLNIQDNCGLNGESSRKHCFIYLNVSSTANFANELEWTHYIGWDEIAQYRIFRKSANIDNYELIAAVNGNIKRYTDDGLCDKEYQYYVQAINANGDERSNSFAVTKKPQTGINTIKNAIRSASVVDDQEIEIHWNRSTFEHFDHFVLNKYDKSGFLLETTVVQDSFYTDYDVSASDQSYTYSVQEVDKCGVSNEAGRVGKTMLLNVSYDNIAQASDLQWSAYEDWKDGVEAYFVALYSEQGDEMLATTTNTDFNDKEYHSTLNGNYCYRIMAVNNIGDTSYSNKVCVTGDPISYIPNAFTPNNDGLNDVFRPTCRFVDHQAEVKGFQMEIYNRWGEMIFRTNDLINGWDGNYDNIACPQGVYTYKIKYRGSNSMLYNHGGTLTLLK